MGWKRQTKSDRPSKCDCASHSASSYLENRLTFENQTWYTYKRVTLEHIDNIIYIIIQCYLKRHHKHNFTAIHIRLSIKLAAISTIHHR